MFASEILGVQTLAIYLTILFVGMSLTALLISYRRDWLPVLRHRQHRQTQNRMPKE